MKRTFQVIRAFSGPAVLALAAILLIASGCAQRKAQMVANLPFTEAMAKKVSHITSGLVSSDQAIRVRFVDPVVSAEKVGQENGKPAFSFKPGIKGRETWEDPRTLSFKPESFLDPGQSYEGQVDVNSVLGVTEKDGPGPLVFGFEVAGRELSLFQGDLKLFDDNNPELVNYEGKVVLTQPADKKLVDDAVLLTVGGKKIPLSWAASKDGKTFSFASEEIRRGPTASPCVLEIRSKSLGMRTDVRKEFDLPGTSELSVTSVSMREGGRRPNIVVSFSDELDLKKSVEGLIGVEPSVEFQTLVLGKDVLVSGPFEPGAEYDIIVRPGIKSRWGTQIKEEVRQTVLMEDVKPMIRFSGSGVFLPSANRRSLRFETVNVKWVSLHVQKVFESNVGQFLQTEKLASPRSRNEEFNSWDFNRVGVDVFQDTLVIGPDRNVWRTSELDLKQIIPVGEKGLFVVSLSFGKKDMLYGEPPKEGEEDEEQDWGYGSDYYSNPRSPGYIYRFGAVHKAVITSDIGLIVKTGYEQVTVWATDIIDASPKGEVKVTLRSFQNQILGQKNTDGDGRAKFSGIETPVFWVEGEKDGQRSVVKPDEMAWNVSGFDTGGETEPTDGLKTFIATERGVYRPGDTVHVFLVLRNDRKTFPDNHPVGLKWINPKNQCVLETTKEAGKEGFIRFDIPTDPDDPTGLWQAQFLVGSKTFQQPIRVETVLPYRLKILCDPPKKSIGPRDSEFLIPVQANYLFGNPAAGHDATVEVTLQKSQKEFPDFRAFRFSNDAIDYQPVTDMLFQGTLDGEGRADVKWQLPSWEGSPSALRAVVKVRVLERGGRPDLFETALPIDPFERYVGYKKFQDDRAVIRVGSEVSVPVVLVSGVGKAVDGQALIVRIFRNRSWWWWEYESQETFRFRYKEDSNTELVSQETLVTGKEGVALRFTPEDRGEYLVEIEDKKGGHTAGLFVEAYYWGDEPAGGNEADFLTLKTDKPTYKPGDKAIISFSTPKEGRILFTVEKGFEILSSRWVKPDAGKTETKIILDVTQAMVPNAYACVSLIQPHSQTLNDRPIRSYGIVPIMVEDPASRQEIAITAPEAIEPNTSFKIHVQTRDKKPAQFAIAVVDEGLLDITRFRTPDPWAVFFSKVRLDISTSDLFSHVIGANKGDVFRVFSIGGDFEEEYRSSQLASEKERRFPPVSLVKGPLFTDGQGGKDVTFFMPNYVGSVRIMVISAQAGRFGSAEMAVPVRSELALLATLPRVLGPQDRALVPVSVFSTRPGASRAEVEILADGPMKIVGEKKKTVTIPGKGEKALSFEIEGSGGVGISTVTVRASSQGRTTATESKLLVRASSPRISSSEEKTLVPGEKISFVVPDRGIPGSNAAKIRIQRRPKMNFHGRLNGLIQYPYGCLEQTVSAVFPQLYLKKIIRTDVVDESNIDKSIQAALDRLRQFQIPSGGMSLWPAGDEVSDWVTSYAGHFMIEAGKMGYQVPQDLFQSWLQYEKSQALSVREALLSRLYRVYLLALAGEPHLGAMNHLRESAFREMDDTEKWLLAGAYRLAGLENAGEDLVRGAGFKTSTKEDWAAYRSALRDKAVMLDMCVLFGRWEQAQALADEIGETLASDTWYSTQATGFALLALGKYFTAIEGNDHPVMTGSFVLPDGSKIPFSTEDPSYGTAITSGFGKPVQVVLEKTSALNRAFAVLEWSGIPMAPVFGDVSRNLDLSVEWLNEDGNAIDPSRMVQGTVFWLHLRARPSSSVIHSIESLALVQVLPSGWEIENIRLSGEDIPAWMEAFVLHNELSQDIRDDRVMWFFDFSDLRQPLDFVVKLNAVTIGTFDLPPTLLEAMYDNRYMARRGGGRVTVVPR